MTRDAKIGLLLGLAFIFVIAFIVNGLPSLRGDKNKNSNELTAGMVNSPNRESGIGGRERRVLNPTTTVDNQEWSVTNALMEEQGIRFTTPLPYRPLADASKNPSGLQERVEIGPSAPRVVEEKIPVVVRSGEPVKPAFPKVYVVEDGDNLSTIALKFYGPEEGNKRANIAKLFQANSKLLSTPDEIKVGQKLTIPALSALTGEQERSDGGLASSLFEKVKSIGREHLPLKKPEVSVRVKSYTVRDGDSLWRIAEAELGDGSRYKEIVTLNKDVLSDEDSLTVGMALKIPPK
jgi:nucleoid-associated protein YgaU